MSEKKCKGRVEIFSRVVGMFTPVQNWNLGKQEEFKQRQVYNIYEKNTENRDTEKNIV